ncbi:MAG: hypothetical protein EB060_12075 [Proteobacteria bacterium]|nr:hypothetical protein [Pseudomonadota bacterium]
MKVESVSIEKLIPYARNPRINAHLVDEVAASIKEFGFQQNIVVDSEMVIVVGHVRYMAAQKLGMKEVPVSIMKVSKAKARAYRIADNKLGEKSQWDNQLLHLEIGELEEEGYDKTKTGFNEEEINNLHATMARLQEDGIDGEEQGDVEEADTNATIGPYRFVIERGEFLEWIEEIKQRVGFDKEAIVAELRKRLGV